MCSFVDEKTHIFVHLSVKIGLATRLTNTLHFSSWDRLVSARDCPGERKICLLSRASPGHPGLLLIYGIIFAVIWGKSDISSMMMSFRLLPGAVILGNNPIIDGQLG